MSEFQYPQDRAPEMAKAYHRDPTPESDDVLHGAIDALPESAPTYTELANAILRVADRTECGGCLNEQPCTDGICRLADRLRAELRSSKADQLASLDEILSLRFNLDGAENRVENLTAELDAMRPVVQAAEAWRDICNGTCGDGGCRYCTNIDVAVKEYRNAHTGSEQRSHDTEAEHE